MSEALDDDITYYHLCFNRPVGDWGSTLNPVLVKESWARVAEAGATCTLE